MSHLKEFQPTFLQSNASGKLYARLYFRNYQELAGIICGLNENMDLLANLMKESANHKTAEDIGIALEAVTQIMKQLNEAVYHEFTMLDQLREAIG